MRREPPSYSDPICPYNERMNCYPNDYKRICHRCGWNPAVAKKRAIKAVDTMLRQKGEDHEKNQQRT